MAAALWHARVDHLIRSLAALDVESIRAAATAARAHDGDLAEELEWWRETVAVERELRRSHRSRDATIAARRAVQALELAATRAGLPASDPDVRVLAEAVRSVARATVIGYEHALEHQVLPARQPMWSQLLDRRSA